MNRTSICRAVVLHNRRIGEIHKGLTLLTDRQGLIEAMAYGANSTKGRLRSIARPFCYGTCWLYTTSKSHKVTDFTVESWFQGIGEQIEKFYAASLWSELIIDSFGGGGEPQPIFDLLVGALTDLNDCPVEQTPFVSMRFLWHYIIVNGVQLNVESCMRCQRRIDPDEERAYSPQENAIRCSGCAGQGMIHLSPTSTTLLARYPDRGVDTANCDLQTAEQLLGVAYGVAQNLIERPLHTLRIGRELLHGA